MTSFLKDTSAALNSKFFATCFPCREKSARATRKRKASRQFNPESPSVPPETSIPASVITIRASFLVRPVTPPPPPLPRPATPSPPPLSGFLPAEQW
ncbi:hypothetical protein OCU04_008530 [Sclerotinia nivalis]|uniref:Uncharacterized protein n=1 Tax=Sclerotinia nivalis TaxID=352851 RepID=A0A9X0DI57_9HELO|nr:hypothetical protein OCU04_008530 [Sclerotinia nivalis]